MTDANSLRKEAYPTWPVPVANWRPQISVQPNQLNMQIGYKAASSDKLQPNPAVDSDDVEVAIGTDESVWNEKYPDVAGLPSAQIFQSTRIKSLPLPNSFINAWNEEIRPSIMSVIQEITDPAVREKLNTDIRQVLNRVAAEYIYIDYPTTVEVRNEKLASCLPPVSEQTSFIGELPTSFALLLNNTFVPEFDESGNALPVSAQERLLYNQRLNIRQDWVSTATFQRNTAGSIYNRGPAVQGVQVEYPYIATNMQATYLEPFSKPKVPRALRTAAVAPNSTKFTSQTGQSIIIPGTSFASAVDNDIVPALALKNLPRCYQSFASPSFAKDGLFDLQRTRPEIYGARTTRANKFFSVAPASANALYASFQRSNIRSRR